MAADELVMRRAECCCGMVSIQLTGEPVMHAVCHCADCKKRTGSAFGMSAYFLNSQVLCTQGSTSVYGFDAMQSRGRQERHFCPQCGTTVFWAISTFPDLTGVAGGCFIDELPEPKYTFSTAEKCDWLTLPQNWKTSLDAKRTPNQSDAL